MTVLLRCTLQYHGARYLGWQETQEGPSIQGTLRRALTRMAQQPVTVEAASRTDAGVHAKGQVVGLWLPSNRYSPERWITSLQRMLPADIGIDAWEVADPTWHPTLSVVGKAYRYRLSLQRQPLMREFIWEILEEALDMESMMQAMRLFLGRHDFTAMATDVVDHPIRNPICTLHRFSMERPSEDVLSLTLVGDRFLYKMCRTLVGTLLDVGRGRIAASAIPSILSSGQRHLAGLCAPPHGLILERVFYEVSEMEGWVASSSTALES